MIKLQDLNYFEIDMGAAFSEIRPALLQNIHGYNAHHGNSLGVDFFGSIARVFGAEQPLKKFYNQVKMQRLITLCEQVKPPSLVPSTSQAVVVARHRQSSRNQPARLRRFAKRNPGIELQAKTPIKSDLAVSLNSKSTKNDFLLKLSRRPAPLTDSVQFNGYGLCEQGFSVPFF